MSTWLLIRTLGREQATTLQRHLGGGYVRFPKAMTNDHPVAKVLGLDAATQLSRAYDDFAGASGDNRLWIGKHLVIRERNDTIARVASEGRPPKAIAELFGLSYSSVCSILAKQRDHTP